MSDIHIKAILASVKELINEWENDIKPDWLIYRNLQYIVTADIITKYGNPILETNNKNAKITKEIIITLQNLDDYLVMWKQYLVDFVPIEETIIKEMEEKEKQIQNILNKMGLVK